MSFAPTPPDINKGPLSDLETVYFSKYADGELLWGAADGSNEEPTGRLKEANIVYILQQNNKTLQWDPEGHYFIYSLAEGADPFGLLISFVADRNLPKHIIDKYLLTSVPDHLVCDANHRTTIVVSTHSGLCQAEAFYQSLLSGLLGTLHSAKEQVKRSGQKDGDGYEVIITQSDQTIKDLGKLLLESTSGQTRTIILLSGDGGVVDLLNGADQARNLASSTSSGARPTIALLPLGTGNALFHSLQKPLYADPKAPSHYVLGLRTLFRGVPAPLPTFEASFAPGSRLISYSDSAKDEAAEEQRRDVSRLVGAIVASYGFHASLVWESDTPAYRKHGDKRFGMAAGELLKLGHGYEVDLEVRVPGAGQDEWTRLGSEEDKFGYVLATLVSNLEKTFTISPASKPLDGKLRLVSFGDVGGEKTMAVMKAAYDNGSHVDMKWTGENGREEKVGYAEIEEVRVTVREEDGRWRKVCIDGTIVEVPQGGWMRVRTIPEPGFDVVVDKTVLF